MGNQFLFLMFFPVAILLYMGSVGSVSAGFLGIGVLVLIASGVLLQR